MGKLIVPRHTADLEYIIPALEVYYEEKDWVSTSVYKDKLFEKLKANKKETVRNSDETHYTKCSEIPRYFGLLEREFSGKSSSNVRITESGKSFYEAFVKKDYNSLHAIIMNALEKIRFGRNNEGCGSDTNVEAPNAVIISMLLLDGISNKEAAFVLGELNDKKEENQNEDNNNHSKEKKSLENKDISACTRSKSSSFKLKQTGFLIPNIL